MENLIFSLNATVPVFLMMILGLLFRKIGWIDDVFASKMNRFVFTVPLPVLVFSDLATVDFSQVWNMKFVLFCFGATIISIAISSALSFFWKDKSIQGEFIQASYRSSAALLGIAFIQNIYGTAGMAPLMIIGSVPLYNIMAVLVLSLFKPGQSGLDKKVIKKTLKGIVTNPIIIGIATGLIWSALKIPMPPIVAKTVSSIGGVATPMGLMAMGATFDIKKAFAKVKPSVAAAFIKLVGFCAIFLPIAVRFGFREEELVAILVMLGSATTVSCFVMAKNMGHEGILSSNVVMLTTLFSAFTLTGWLYILKSMGFI
ncbi:AEC family transporter [Bariatricus sp. SGI.154]|uniref:AEC family transporter n=1 Tax=Bariatricus sp. SGI.154 TaxID=3420549 RepID=UPI003CFDEE32